MMISNLFCFLVVVKAPSWRGWYFHLCLEWGVGSSRWGFGPSTDFSAAFLFSDPFFSFIHSYIYLAVNRCFFVRAPYSFILSGWWWCATFLYSSLVGCFPHLFIQSLLSNYLLYYVCTTTLPVSSSSSLFLDWLCFSHIPCDSFFSSLTWFCLRTSRHQQWLVAPTQAPLNLTFVSFLPLQLKLNMNNNEGEGDTSTFVLNGEWHLLGNRIDPVSKSTISHHKNDWTPQMQTLTNWLLSTTTTTTMTQYTIVLKTCQQLN